MKTPTPRKLKSGSWTIQLMLGGKKISVTKPTKADCIKEPHMLKANYQAGKAEDARHDYPKQRKTFDTYIDNWQSELSASTTNGYKAI